MMVDFAGCLLDVSSRYLGLATKNRTVVADVDAGSGHATRVSDSRWHGLQWFPNSVANVSTADATVESSVLDAPPMMSAR